MKVKNNWFKKLHLSLYSIFYVSYYRRLEEFPIWNFTKCMAGEISHVQRKGTPVFSARTLQIWESMFNQYLALYGLPEAYQSYLKKMVKACSLYAKSVQGERWRLTQAHVQAAAAANALGDVGEDIEITCARLSKFLGFVVNSRKTSVTQFYAYIELMKNG